MRESQYGDEEDQEKLSHVLNNSLDHRDELTSFPNHSKEIKKSKPHS